MLTTIPSVSATEMLKAQNVAMVAGQAWVISPLLHVQSLFLSLAFFFRPPRHSVHQIHCFSLSSMHERTHIHKQGSKLQRERDGVSERQREGEGEWRKLDPDGRVYTLLHQLSRLRRGVHYLFSRGLSQTQAVLMCTAHTIDDAGQRATYVKFHLAILRHL